MHVIHCYKHNGLKIYPKQYLKFGYIYVHNSSNKDGKGFASYPTQSGPRLGPNVA